MANAWPKWGHSAAASHYSYARLRTSTQMTSKRFWMKSNDCPYLRRDGGAKSLTCPAEPGLWADDVGGHFANKPTTAELTREMQFPDDEFSWPVERLSTGERRP